jgi:predicted transcriptional regulator
LAALYHWRLAVLARVMNKSAAQLIAQSVEHYLESNWESHDRLIEAECPPGMEVETFIQQIISTD